MASCQKLLTWYLTSHQRLSPWSSLCVTSLFLSQLSILLPFYSFARLKLSGMLHAYFCNTCASYRVSSFLLPSLPQSFHLLDYQLLVLLVTRELHIEVCEAWSSLVIPSPYTTPLASMHLGSFSSALPLPIAAFSFPPSKLWMLRPLSRFSISSSPSVFEPWLVPPRSFSSLSRVVLASLWASLSFKSAYLSSLGWCCSHLRLLAHCHLSSFLSLSVRQDLSFPLHLLLQESRSRNCCHPWMELGSLCEVAILRALSSDPETVSSGASGRFCVTWAMSLGSSLMDYLPYAA